MTVETAFWASATPPDGAAPLSGAVPATTPATCPTVPVNGAVEASCRAAEIDMLAEQDRLDPLDDLKPVSDATEIRAAIAAARRVHVSDAIKGYVVDLANATRSSNDIALGASPRAVLQLIRASKAWAAIDDRDFVLPDDVQHLLVAVLAHRLILTPEAQLSQTDAAGVLRRIMGSIPIPTASRTPQRATGRSGQR